MRIFETLESRVRGYIRSFPVIFESSKGAILKDEMGKEYIDFFAGAGTLNYGHNNDHITKAMIEYLQKDGVLHGLDMATTAKKKFLEKFLLTILEPRNLDYKIQFTGPTGTNAVESALKLARTIKGRSNVVAFTNGYHGLSMGALAVTGNNFIVMKHISAVPMFLSCPLTDIWGLELILWIILEKYLQMAVVALIILQLLSLKQFRRKAV